jgi:hypothetical protein
LRIPGAQYEVQISFKTRLDMGSLKSLVAWWLLNLSSHTLGLKWTAILCFDVEIVKQNLHPSKFHMKNCFIWRISRNAADIYSKLLETMKLQHDVML